MKYVSSPLCWFYVFLGFLFLFYCVYAVYFGEQKLSGLRGSSLTVEFSKKNNLFISNYVLQGSNSINLSKTALPIKNCFTERAWAYGRRPGDVKKEFSKDRDKPYQLVLNYSGDKEGIKEWYLFGKETNNFYPVGFNHLVCYLNEEQLKDTISFFLTVGELNLVKHQLVGGDTIQELVFVKQVE